MNIRMGVNDTQYLDKVAFEFNIEFSAINGKLQRAEHCRRAGIVFIRQNEESVVYKESKIFLVCVALFKACLPENVESLLNVGEEQAIFKMIKNGGMERKIWPPLSHHQLLKYYQNKLTELRGVFNLRKDSIPVAARFKYDHESTDNKHR